MRPVPCFYLFKKLFPLCVILLLILIDISEVNAKGKDKDKKKDDGDCGLLYKIVTLGLGNCGSSKSKTQPEPATQQTQPQEQGTPPTPAKEKERKVETPKPIEKTSSFNPSDGVTPKFSLVGMKPVESIESKEEDKQNAWVEGYVTPPVPDAKSLPTDKALVKDGNSPP